MFKISQELANNTAETFIKAQSSSRIIAKTITTLMNTSAKRVEFNVINFTYLSQMGPGKMFIAHATDYR